MGRGAPCRRRYSRRLSTVRNCASLDQHCPHRLVDQRPRYIFHLHPLPDARRQDEDVFSLAEWIVAQLAIKPGDAWLELGPGLGALTEFALARSACDVAKRSKKPTVILNGVSGGFATGTQ